MLVNFHLQIAPPELMRQTQSPESVIVCLISQAICRDRVIALIRVHTPGAPGPSHLGTWAEATLVGPAVEQQSVARPQICEGGDLRRGRPPAPNPADPFGSRGRQVAVYFGSDQLRSPPGRGRRHHSCPHFWTSGAEA
jgi:hypothetical protein